MRRCVAVTTFVLLAAAVSGQAALQACGDKFFQVGRGDRFSRAYNSLYPGRIVIYTGGPSKISKGLGDGRLQKYFTRAGHRVTVAKDAATLERTLAAGNVDLVVASLPEALELLTRVDGATSRPTLLPVSDPERDPSPREHQFAAVLKSSDKITGFLATIEDVMKARSSASGPRTN